MILIYNIDIVNIRIVYINFVKYSVEDFLMVIDIDIVWS